MINGVKRFGRVKEENEVLLAAGKGLGAGVEGVVEVVDVVSKIPSRDETFLGGMEEGVKRAHEDVGHDSSKNAIVEVVDSDGTHFVDEVGVVFGDKVEEANVKVGWDDAFGEVDEEAVEDGSGDVGKEAVGRRRNAVQASRGVRGIHDGIVDVALGGKEDRAVLDALGVVVEIVVELGAESRGVHSLAQ